MQPVKLELYDFLSHKESVLDFTRLNRISLIIGEIENNPEDSNGAGKSTLLDGVLFALFGQCRSIGEKRGLNLNHVIRDGTQKAQVVLEFIVHDIHYRITRSRILQNKDKGRSEAILQVDNNGTWQPASGDSIRETDKKLVKLIGADYDTFVNTVLFPQGDISSFAAMSANERKDVVRHILQLEQYDGYEEAARQRVRDYNRELESVDRFFEQHVGVEEEIQKDQERLVVLEGAIENKQQQIKIGEQKVEHLRNELAALKADAEHKLELEQTVEALNEEVRQAVTNIEAATKKQEEYETNAATALQRFERFSDEVKIKAAQRPDRQVIQVAADRNKQEKDRWQKTVDERKQANIAIGTRINGLEEDVFRIAHLEAGKCPTCNGIVTPESKEHSTQELQEQIAHQQEVAESAQRHLTEAKQHLTKVLAEEEDLKEQAESFNTYVRELKLLQEQASAARERYQGLKTMLEDVTEMTSHHEKNALHSQEQLEAAQKKLQKLEDVDESRFTALQANIQETGLYIEGLRAQSRENEIEKRLIGARTKENEAIVAEIHVRREESATLERKRRVYQELTKAFSKAGIQAIILENCAFEIEEIANDILHRLTNGRVQVEIQTQRESSTGRIQEVFDILIKSGQRIAPFELYSGGEGLRIAFAIRIALSTLLARRAGTQISTLWYDEAFAQLDGSGRSQLIEAFEILAQQFDYQLVISHRNDLQSEFEGVVTIKKQGEYSTIVQ